MSRIELNTLLKTLLGNDNVYYQPPSNFTMSYPAIRYTIKRRDSKSANSKPYIRSNQYEVIVIDRMPDNPVIDELLNLPGTSFDRHYVSDNLNHDVLTIYY